jgi:hypothetical protein
VERNFYPQQNCGDSDALSACGLSIGMMNNRKRMCKMAKKKIPNPGSDAAIKMGCKCPVLDNGHGRGCGWVGEDGTELFWQSDICPIHVYKESEVPKKNLNLEELARFVVYMEGQEEDQPEQFCSYAYGSYEDALHDCKKQLAAIVDDVRYVYKVFIVPVARVSVPRPEVIVDEL